MGFSQIPDGHSPEASSDGLMTLDMTINQKMKRMSTMDAFLPKELALKRQSHLTICTRSHVSRIEFSKNQAERRAERVYFQKANSKSNRTFSVKVKKEAIISSGALISPQVLMLSGIGPRDHLEEHGIEVIYDLPGVGLELSDHVSIPVEWETPVKESLTHTATCITKGLREMLRYIIADTGVLSTSVQALSLFVRGTSLDEKQSNLVSVRKSPPLKDTENCHLRSKELLPDIEIMPLACSAVDDVEEYKAELSKIGVFCMLACLLQPKSRGTVRLGSSNPLDRPKVDFNFMEDAEDWAMARKAIRLALNLGDRIKAQGFPLLRGITAPASDADDDTLNELIKRRARTTYHFSSSCRMATESDSEAPGVVDDSLRVHGIANLRVCDASVFPNIVTAHLQAPVVMVAEKCADMIKASRQ